MYKDYKHFCHSLKSLKKGQERLSSPFPFQDSANSFFSFTLFSSHRNSSLYIMQVDVYTSTCACLVCKSRSVVCVRGVLALWRTERLRELALPRRSSQSASHVWNACRRRLHLTIPPHIVCPLSSRSKGRGTSQGSVLRKHPPSLLTLATGGAPRSVDCFRAICCGGPMGEVAS